MIFTLMMISCGMFREVEIVSVQILYFQTFLLSFIQRDKWDAESRVL